jgi:hypothetical protein
MLKLVKRSQMKNHIKNKKNFFTISGINMIIKDDLNFSLDHKELSEVLKRMPKSFTRLVDYIIFGNFDFLSKMHFNAAFKDGAIYVSSTQIDNSSVIENIVLMVLKLIFIIKTSI